jgi:hypothetical protein
MCVRTTVDNSAVFWEWEFPVRDGRSGLDPNTGGPDAFNFDLKTDEVGSDEDARPDHDPDLWLEWSHGF